MKTPERFTIRAYGLLIDAAKRILVADEAYGGITFTKFPGGGLEYGEGLHECLLREWNEELEHSIEITGHFYTTDFFQQSAFNPDQQVISVYYLVKDASNSPAGNEHLLHSGENRKEKKLKDESFRWIASEKFHEGVLSFPIDKYVASMLKKSGLI